MENNKLICPFCQQEYIIPKDDSCFGQQRCVCRNPNCEFDGWHFPIKLVSELIRTRKALEIAVDALKTVRRYTAINQFAPKSREAHIVAKKAVAKITELEQQP